MDSSPSRIELLVLSTLARRPMHGYEVKIELRYRHVRWWARCEHGHLYAALARLEREGHIAPVGEEGGRKKRVFAVTEGGRAHLRAMLESVGEDEDGPYFDVDLFLAGAFTLPREAALALLSKRADAMQVRLTEAAALQAAMAGKVPAAALLIMEHRAGHLRHEIAFTEHAHKTLAALPEWGAFLGDEPIESFLARQAVSLEDGTG